MTNLFVGLWLAVLTIVTPDLMVPDVKIQAQYLLGLGTQVRYGDEFQQYVKVCNISGQPSGPMTISLIAGEVGHERSYWLIDSDGIGAQSCAVFNGPKRRIGVQGTWYIVGASVDVMLGDTNPANNHMQTNIYVWSSTYLPLLVH